MRLLNIWGLVLIFSVYASGALADERAITLVCDEWPPYQVTEKNRVSGFCTKVVEEVFKKMGVKIAGLDVYPWKRAIAMLEMGKTDALFSANFTRERTAYAHYPKEPLIQSPWVVWVREEDGFTFNALSDLKYKKVGVVRGYSYTGEFWDYIKKNAKPDEVTDDETNFKKLNAARIDCTVAELGNGYHILKELKIKRIIPLKNRPIKEDGLYVLFNKTTISEAFVKKFSAELKKVKEGLLYPYLYNEYLGEKSIR
jgi:polar amino acid transport system substrate-binding protein